MALRRKVQVFLYRQDPFRVLLLQRGEEKGREWQPVTGNVDPHEQLRAAAVREAWEEATIEIEPEPLGVTFTYEKASGPRKGRYHETVFAAASPDEDVELSDEHVAFEWVTPEVALERLAWPEQKKALEALVARYGRK